MSRRRKRSADEGRRGPRRRGWRAPLVEEVVDALETEVAEVCWPCLAEEETVPVGEVERRLVAVVDGLSWTLVRAVT